MRLLLYRVLFYCSLFMLLGSINVKAERRIEINNQTEFDRLSSIVMSAISSGEKRIDVVISPGDYVFKEEHLSIINLDAPDVSVFIEGKGSRLFPEGKILHNGDRFDKMFAINDSWTSRTNNLKVWSDVYFADGIIEVVDIEKKECALKINTLFQSKVDCKDAFILIPHWFQSSVYKITRVVGNRIYFIASDLGKSSYGDYNVNDDANYGHEKIRFKVCNLGNEQDRVSIFNSIVNIPSNCDEAISGAVKRFATFRNCKLKQLDISGLSFYGGASGSGYPFIFFWRMDCGYTILRDCSFIGVRNTVIGISESKNVRVQNNKFQDCYSSGVYSDNYSSSTVISGNSFTSMGLLMQNSFCVKCSGSDFIITDNVFRNFGYGGIGAGVWYNSKKVGLCTGIIEGNDLAYDDDYIQNIDNYSIMDSGAIYLWTKNDGVTIRGNYIHGYSGMKDNRGIFCDDGAYNYEIIGNVITGIKNSYSIDSRRSVQVEEQHTPGSGIKRANVNIVIRDNIVDSPIRFVGHEDQDNGCVYGSNYLLHSGQNEMPENTIKNVEVSVEDISLIQKGEKQGRIGISQKSYKQLKKSPEWQRIKGFVVRKGY